MSYLSGEKAYILLADGSIYEGRSFGAVGTAIGETVFATGMTGYEETLTDPLPISSPRISRLTRCPSY
ncbi:MAG: hypothetical protein IKN33_00645 [Selenomonadaceae bacterium]|nr:hypothetical protein [Selenomonadaceae bacterium]